jgi:hypothetical protein
MPLDRPEGQGRRTGLAHSSDDTAMAPGRHIAAGPGVTLLDFARREDLFILDNNRADTILSILIRPDARDDVVDRIDDVSVAIVAKSSVRPLRGVADNRYRSID